MFGGGVIDFVDLIVRKLADWLDWADEWLDKPRDFSCATLPYPPPLFLVYYSKLF